MTLCHAVCLASVLVLSAAHPSQQQPAVSQQPSAADQLSALLDPVVERAVSRAQSGCQLAQLTARLEQLQVDAEAGQRALAELTRQQVRLDTVAHDVAALQLSALAGGGRDGGTECGAVCQPPSPEPPSEPEQEQTACQERPAPLPAEAASYQEPAVRACGRSCLQLRHQGVTRDGVYWLTGLPVPVLCDFSHDGGGWTLLLTAVSRQGWDPLSVLGRSELSPSLTNDYSILRHANTLRDLGTGDRFAYRIEAQAEKGRQRWGGIWFAPRHYSFVDETGTQTEVSLVRRFDDWVYKGDGIKKRMPWINTGGENPYRMHPVLTTASKTEWWGTIVTHHTYTRHNHSPWYNPNVVHSGNMLYWMREDALP